MGIDRRQRRRQDHPVSADHRRGGAGWRRLRLGETVKLGYVDQSRSTLDPEKTVWEVISEGSDSIWLGRAEVNSRAYVGRFNFTGRDQQKPVRAALGRRAQPRSPGADAQGGANVLLLDEPTNDLDVNTLRALEEAILAFAGCVLVISHDRWFLDRIATHILAFEGDSHVEWFPGGYSDYVADREDAWATRPTAPPGDLSEADTLIAHCAQRPTSAGSICLSFSTTSIRCRPLPGHTPAPLSFCARASRRQPSLHRSRRRRRTSCGRSRTR